MLKNKYRYKSMEKEELKSALERFIAEYSRALNKKISRQTLSLEITSGRDNRWVDNKVSKSGSNGKLIEFMIDKCIQANIDLNLVFIGEYSPQVERLSKIENTVNEMYKKMIE
jgi:hypothetical protein